MADGRNELTVSLKLDLKDDTLRQAKAKLDEFSKKYEALTTLRSTFAKKGTFSSGFVLVDEELKKSLKNVTAAKDGYLKALKDYESGSAPLLKRTGGLLHRIWYGNTVGTPEEADKEERKVTQRVSAFQRRLVSTLAFSSAVSRTLTPLPGGEVLHAGFEGAQTGASEAMFDPKTGESRSMGVGGLLRGVAGGLKGFGAAAALSLLGKAVSGAVAGGREDESLRRLLTPAAGSVTLGRQAVSVARGAPGLTAEEAAPFVAGAYRTGGTALSARAALRAQLTMGMGGEFTQLQGSLAHVGVPGRQAALDASARKMWSDIIAAGYDTSLKRVNPRLVTEGLAGAVQIVGRTTLGARMGDVGNIFRTQRFLEGGFGGRSFDMMAKTDEMMKGQTSPLARALGLMAGLRSGKSFVGATLEMEKGLFGQGAMTQDSVAALKKRVTETANLFGGLGSENAIMGVQAMLGPGATMTEAKSLIDLVREDAGVGQFEEARKGAMTVEQQAYDAMSRMDWKTIDRLLERIEQWLGQIFHALGGEKGLIKLLETTSAVLATLSEFITGVKTKGFGETVTGVKGLAGEEFPDLLMRRLRGQTSVFEAGSPQFTETLKGVAPEERRRMEVEAQQERARLQQVMKENAPFGGLTRDIGIRERAVEMKDKTFRFVIELVDLDRQTVLRTIEQKHVEESKPPQWKFVPAPAP